jgi:hypothetical protein
MTVDDLIALEEVRQLRGAYCAYLDHHELDALVGLFTEDAVCEFGDEFGRWNGREEIRRGYVQALADIGSRFDSMHVVTNPWITIEGPNRAHGRWYLIDLLARQAPHSALSTRGGHDNPLLYLGVYEDDYVKVDGAWRFAHVKLHFLWPQKSFTVLRHASA